MKERERERERERPHKGIASVGFLVLGPWTPARTNCYDLSVGIVHAKSPCIFIINIFIIISLNIFQIIFRDATKH